MLMKTLTPAIVISMGFTLFAAGQEPVLASPNPALIRAASSSAAWGGERTGNQRSERVADYQLKAVLHPETHQIEGSETVTWRNRSNVPVAAVYLHLYLNAFESEGSTFAVERRQLGGFRTDVETETGQWGFIDLKSVTQNGAAVSWSFVHPDNGPDTDHTVVRLDLPQPVLAGEETKLDIVFFDQLPRVVARTGWFGSFHLVGQWYPKIGVLELPGERGATEPRWNCHEFHLNSEFYGDFGSYRLEVVAPAKFTVGASGTLASAPKAEPDGVHHFYQVDDVHDVVFTAWDGFAPALNGSTQIEGGATVAVEVLAPAEYAEGAAIAMRATLDALRWFSKALGPYPYPKVTVVVPPFNAAEAGGMEYETFFTTLVGLSAPLNSESVIRFVTVHEFGHGYVSGLLASNEFEEPFLDEGMNEVLDRRMLEPEAHHLKPPAILRWLGVTLPSYHAWTSGLAAGRPRFPTDAIAAPSWNRFSGSSYSQVYSRTHMVMHDLGIMLGEAVFDRALKLYYQRWHFRHPSTADLKEAFVDAGGDRAMVERWFESQVYRASAVDDRIEKLSTTEVLPDLGSRLDAGTRFSLEDQQRDDQRSATRAAWKAAHGEIKKETPGPYLCRSLFSVRRYGAGVDRKVEATFADGSTERFDWKADEPWRRFEIERATCVRSVSLDAAGTLTLDNNLLDNTRSKTTFMKAATILGLEAFSWIQTLAALVQAL